MTIPYTASSSTISQQLHGQRMSDDFARLRQFQRAVQEYHKQNPPPIPLENGRPNTNVRVNLVKVIVETGISFLFGAHVDFKLEKSQTTESLTDDPEELYLKAVWKHNRKMTWLYKQGINGALCGHIFVRIYPESPYPRLVILDPATVTVRWAADDLDRVEQYIIAYNAYEWQHNHEKLVAVRQLIQRTDGGRWDIIDQRGTPDRNDYYEVSREAWPYDFPPILDCQNIAAPNEFWGEPDITDDLIDLINAGDFTLSNNQKILRFYGEPLTVGKGMQPEQLKHGRDRTVFIPKDADLYNVELQSDLASALTHYQTIKSSIHEVAHMPEITSGKLDNVGNLSGLALQILYGPLLRRTTLKRMLYGDFLTELNRRLLVIGNFANTDTTIVWDAMLPVDSVAEGQAALIDKKLGVSDETLLTQRGYDATAERKKRDAEAERPSIPLNPVETQGEDIHDSATPAAA